MFLELAPQGEYCLTSAALTPQLHLTMGHINFSAEDLWDVNQGELHVLREPWISRAL